MAADFLIGEVEVGQGRRLVEERFTAIYLIVKGTLKVIALHAVCLQNFDKVFLFDE